MSASKVVGLLLIGFAAALLGGAEARMAIACSPYVYPCHCGLCPHIVDCETKQSAECFCGRASTSPGIYPHPTEKNKYWMCSYDSARKTAYGVEATCPYQLVWDNVVKVCTFPDAVTQQPTLQEKPSTTPVAPPPAAAAAKTTDKGVSSGTEQPKASTATPASTTTTTAATTPSTTPTAITVSKPSTPVVTVAPADTKLPAKAVPAAAKVGFQQPTTTISAFDMRPAATPRKP